MDADLRSTRRVQPRWRRWLPWIGLFVLAWILSRMDGAAMRHALGSVSAGALLMAAAAFSANLFLKAWRWQRLLQAQRIELPLRVSLAAFLSGQFYAQVTLGRLGEFFRIEALLERGVSAGKALASCVFDRLLDVFIVFGLGAVFATRVLADRALAWLALALLLAGAVALGLLLRFAVPLQPGAAPNGLQRWLGRLEEWSRREAPATDNHRKDRALQARAFRRVIGRLVHSGRELLSGMLPMLRGRVLAEALFWSAVSWFGYFEALFQLADGLSLGVSRVLLTATAAFAALTALLPVTVSGLGARELIYIQVLERHGVANETAVVLSLLHLFTMSVCATGFGFLGVLWRQRQRDLELRARS
ncbi:MAG TPA: lysylphosphatidylglycerol synthase transmembrane domain-containing protein [Polyangiales bacterium]|nr:lysylphosphatidylglycerol synthase transmembrane domain-containing protein [Polyangiales bacterium]